PLFAALQTATPNPSLTLQLRDDLAAPPPAADTPTRTPGTLPPPIDPTPAGGVTPPAATRPTEGGAWSPGGTAATRPAPHSFGSPASPVPAITPPPPADLTPRPAVKPENFADGP